MSAKPEGYAPDMFSEHARFAQLGQQVLRIVAQQLLDESEPGLERTHQRASAFGVILGSCHVFGFKPEGAPSRADDETAHYRCES